MARGQRRDRVDGPGPTRRFIQTGMVRADWRDLQTWGHGLLLLPELAPDNSDPERVVLRCWRAHPIAGGYEPAEELGLTRLSREPDGSWRPIGPF